MRNSSKTHGFSLPSAYKSAARQHDHVIAIATLIASICVMSIVGANMMWS